MSTSYLPNAVLQKCLRLRAISPEDWTALPGEVQTELLAQSELVSLTQKLLDFGLITPFQAERIQRRKTAGLVVGNYRLLEVLGTGATGIVYKGEHLWLRKPAAIKVIEFAKNDRAASSVALADDLTLRVIAQLRHRHIVALLDAGEEIDESQESVLRYFVMDFVRGQNLEEHVRKHGRLPIPVACALVSQIAGALVEAQRVHLVHRDIKPSNVLITDDNMAKLLDFGLARESIGRHAEAGALQGTLEYMAPEQLLDADVDVRADLHALGGSLYWCLTGKPPFSFAGSLNDYLAQRDAEPPPSVRRLRPEVPQALDAIVKRLLAVQPRDRLPHPASVIEALRPFCPAEKATEDEALTEKESLRDVRDALVITVAKLVELRDKETTGHAMRLQRFCRLLAENAATEPAFAGQIETGFIDLIESCVPLHDMGNAGLPAEILHKAGTLTVEERAIMQTHPVFGAQVLREAAKHHALAGPFLQMAIDIVRSHHEHYDGNGYPDQLQGNAIPLAARILAVADVYDALRSRRAYKPALPHHVAVPIMKQSFGKIFDPALEPPFQRCGPQFADIFRQFED